VLVGEKALPGNFGFEKVGLWSFAAKRFYNIVSLKIEIIVILNTLIPFKNNVAF